MPREVVMNSSIFIQAAWQKAVPRVPVWLMRQAGRYMKEYRALRARYSFLELCKTPDCAAEVTLLPVGLLGVDAAILFADILLPAEAMGMELYFGDAGPCFSKPCQSEADVYALRSFCVDESFAFMRETIGLVQSELPSSTPLIGFAGGPFTLMSYMVEGQSSRDLKRTKRLMHESPELVKALLSKLTDALLVYVDAQIRWGVNAIQIFDTWAGLLSPYDFHCFALPYLVELLSRVSRRDVPVILFAKGNGAFYQDLLLAQPDVLSLDWNANLPFVKSQLVKSEVGQRVAVQGNLDPYVLYAEPRVIQEYAKTLLSSMKDYEGFIFNLGHGVLPDTPFEHVRCLVDTVKEYGC